MNAEPTDTELESRHQALIEQLRAVGDMPMDTDEQRLARYEARAEVSLALAAVYEAKKQRVPLGGVVGMALIVAERDRHIAADFAREHADNARRRIASRQASR